MNEVPAEVNEGPATGAAVNDRSTEAHALPLRRPKAIAFNISFFFQVKLFANMAKCMIMAKKENRVGPWQWPQNV